MKKFKTENEFNLILKYIIYNTIRTISEINTDNY